MSAPTSEVVEHLHRLVARAPTGSLDPDALWTRGRRQQRRRGMAVAACVSVLAGLGAAGAAPLVRLIDPPVATAPEGAGMVLPDAIRTPGRWEPAFSHAPGPLSAVGRGVRGGWGNDRASLWGVSALTGESRFVDLPDSAPTFSFDSTALSDDGTRLAYWTSTGTPGEPAEEGRALVPTGVAILDLTTGDVRLWDAGTTMGLQTEALVWAGDTLWFRAGAFRGSEYPAPTTWTWGAIGEPEVATASPWDNAMAVTSPSSDGFLTARGTAARRVRTVDAAGVFTTVRLVHAGSTTSEPRLSRDGRLIAGLQQTPGVGSSGAPLPLVVGPVEDGRAVLEPVVGVQATSVRGWRSATEVVIGSEMVEGVIEVSSVDVIDGVVSPLTSIGDDIVPTTFAADAWTADVVPAPGAPFAPDPLLVGAGLVALAFVLWRVIVRVRRRRGHP